MQKKEVTWESPPPPPPHGTMGEWVCRKYDKGVKTAMKHVIGSQCLSFSEMQTVLVEIANLLNKRPIGKHPTNPNDGHYLSPNELLLERASARVPSGPFKEFPTVRQRHEFIQSLINSFWKIWIRDVYPHWLFVRNGIGNEGTCKTNGVLLQDHSIYRGQWIMGRVTKV